MKKIINIGLLLLVTGFFASSDLAHARKGSHDGVTAAYNVPVSDDLKQFSIFQITDLKSKIVNGIWEVSYKMPVDLVGYSLEVHYAEKNSFAYLVSQDSLSLQGDHGVLTCKLANARLTDCSAKYNSQSLQVNLPAVEAIWKAKNLPPQVVDGRMAVVESFSGELIGTFTIP